MCNYREMSFHHCQKPPAATHQIQSPNHKWSPENNQLTATRAGLGMAWSPLWALFLPNTLPKKKRAGKWGWERTERRDGKSAHVPTGSEKWLNAEPSCCFTLSLCPHACLPGKGVRAWGFLLQKKVVQTGSWAPVRSASKLICHLGSARVWRRQEGGERHPWVLPLWPVRGHPSSALDLSPVTKRPNPLWKPSSSCRGALRTPKTSLWPLPARPYQLSNLPQRSDTQLQEMKTVLLIDETLDKITWFWISWWHICLKSLLEDGLI